MNAKFFEEQRREMVAAIRAIAEHIAAELGKTELDERVLRAMAKVPRHEFVPVEVQSYAYLNRPIPIGFDKTISQPLMVAVMTDLLELKPDDMVLEIGTGLGYQSAVLAELAGRVYSVEIIDELAQRAVQRLKRQGYTNVGVRVGNGYAGWPKHAPFDKVIVTAAPDLIPPPLIKPAQDWWKDGDTGRFARRSAACRGRQRLQRQGHNEGNYAGTVLGARGIRRICIPGILIKVIADEEKFQLALEHADSQLLPGYVRFRG
jgi:protein-L-isoaspartate(D-aspartate) O-methyltransferase